MIKWFKRIAKPVPKPSSIAPLYIASTDQIQGTIEAVNELNDRLDNLPPIPDMTVYANKNEANTFTQKQTFNRGMYVNNQKIEGLAAPVGNGDATHKQYVDSADSSKLREAKIYADTQDTAKLQEAKSYTDTQIAAIPAPDLSNVAKLDTQNTFQKSMKVKQGINVEGYLWADTTEFASGTIQSVPNNAKSIVNKEYVDGLSKPKINSERIPANSLGLAETSNASKVLWLERYLNWWPSSNEFAMCILEGRTSTGNFVRMVSTFWQMSGSKIYAIFHQGHGPEFEYDRSQSGNLVFVRFPL